MTFSASTPNLSPHLHEDDLLAIICGDRALSAAERSHLDGCATCRQHFAALELLQQELLVARLSEPTQAAKERYFALSQQIEVNATNPLQAIADHIGHFADAVKASVMWNGRERLAMQGVRNVAATGYRMLYSAEQAEIELLIEPDAGKFRIEGELLPLGASPDLFPVLLELYQYEAAATANQPIFIGESDQVGRFHIPSMPAGNYALYLAPIQGEPLVIDLLELV